MTVDDWTFEAVEALGRGTQGVGIRGIQRFIDERHFEELAIDTLQESLARLEAGGRVERDGDSWRPKRGTSREDAMRRLFGE